MRGLRAWADGWWASRRFTRRHLRALSVVVAGGAVLVIVIAVVALRSGGAGNGRGGIDTGQPDSRCAPRAHRLTSPAEPGTAAGTFGGDYYELGEPIPARRTAPLMMIIHGGGWADVGPGQVASVRGEADKWRRLGWRTLNIDYHACARSVGDVVAFYDRFHQIANGHAICAEGLSAGAHLALMLAAERPRLRCVIALAAPTDLAALAMQRTSLSATRLTGAAPTTGPRYAYNLAVAAFGTGQLAAMSPALHARQITARVLLALATDDILLPWAQAQEFADRHPGYTDVLRLPPGRIVFVHGTTTPGGIEEVSRAERQLVAGLG